MEITTQYVLLSLVIVGILGLLTWAYVEYYGSPSNGGGNQCWPGTTNYPPYGCLTCDPSISTCRNSTKCKLNDTTACNGKGSCIDVGVGDGTGVCACNSPYSGEQCQNSCADSSQCKNGGTCTGGKCICSPGYSGSDCSIPNAQCTAANCGPGCQLQNKCQCKDGWITDPTIDNRLCNTCAPGRGPGNGDCSKKIFTNSGLKLALPECWDVGYRSTEFLNAQCQTYYGNTASWDPTAYECYNNIACNSTTSRAICDVPNFMANPAFPSSTIQTCPTNCPNSSEPVCDSTGNWIEPYKFWQWFGGEIYNPPNTK